MSDRDRLARVVALELVRQAREASDYQNRDCYKVADALIAAGVTMPAPICGATTEYDGVDLACELPTGHPNDALGHCASSRLHWWRDDRP